MKTLKKLQFQELDFSDQLKINGGTGPESQQTYTNSTGSGQDIQHWVYTDSGVLVRGYMTFPAHPGDTIG